MRVGKRDKTGDSNVWFKCRVVLQLDGWTQIDFYKTASNYHTILVVYLLLGRFSVPLALHNSWGRSLKAVCPSVTQWGPPKSVSQQDQRVARRSFSLFLLDSENHPRTIAEKRKKNQMMLGREEDGLVVAAIGNTMAPEEGDLKARNVAGDRRRREEEGLVSCSRNASSTWRGERLLSHSELPPPHLASGEKNLLVESRSIFNQVLNCHFEITPSARFSCRHCIFSPTTPTRVCLAFL